MIAGPACGSTLDPQQFRHCWASRIRRDRTVRAESLPCGAPSTRPSGLCDECWGELTGRRWWRRHLSRASA